MKIMGMERDTSNPVYCRNGRGEMKARRRVFVSIDPGVSALGVCVWQLPPRDFQIVPKRKGPPPRPIDAEAVKFGSGTLEHSAERITDFLGDFLAPYKPARAAIEMMEFFGGSARGQAAAGDVLNVSLMVGAMFGWFHFRGCPVELVPVRMWKGQLSKPQVERRLLKKWGGAELPPGVASHAVDAAGIGLFCMGWF